MVFLIAGCSRVNILLDMSYAETSSAQAVQLRAMKVCSTTLDRAAIIC